MARARRIILQRVTLEEAYPKIEFRPHTRTFFARLIHAPAECVHLTTEKSWMAMLIPDTLYLRGKAATRRASVRPQVSLCRDCLLGVLEEELAAYRGRVVAFEPDFQHCSQYFFVDQADFEAAGLEPETSKAIGERLAERKEICEECNLPATWLWVSHREVSNLDQCERIAAARGARLCRRHGAEIFCRALKSSEEANLLYVNVPYGEGGAYVWI